MAEYKLQNGNTTDTKYWYNWDTTWGNNYSANYTYYCYGCNCWWYGLSHCCNKEKEVEVKVYQTKCPECDRTVWLKMGEEKRCKCEKLLKAVPKPKEQPLEVVVDEDD